MNTVVIARFHRGITPPSDREDDNNSPSYNTVICNILVLTWLALGVELFVIVI